MTSIDALYTQLLSTQSLAQTNSTSGASAATEVSDSFADIMNQALSETSASEDAATSEYTALLTGDNTNIHNVVLAAEKAEVALQLTMQIRNKVLDAYNEIMRMQV